MEKISKHETRLLMLLAVTMVVAIGVTAVASLNEYPDLGVGFFQRESIKVDCKVEKTFLDGHTELISNHAGVLTTIGKDFIEGKLGDSAYGSNANFADYISLTDSASAPSNAWTQIPTEITANGLDRALATYASIGAGTYTILHQFTCATAPQSSRCAGVNWDSGNTDNVLLCADTYSATTCQIGEKITVTFTFTIS
jgi:hypothetical protein